MRQLWLQAVTFDVCEGLSVHRVVSDKTRTYLDHPPQRAFFLEGAYELEVDSVDSPELPGDGTLELRTSVHDRDRDLLRKSLQPEGAGQFCYKKPVRSRDVELAR